MPYFTKLFLHNTFNHRILLLVFTLLILFFSACTPWQEVEVGDVQDVKFRGLRNNHLLLDVVVPVTNPNNRAINVKSFDVKVYINSDEFGRVQNTTGLVIGANSNQTITLPVDVEITGVNKGFKAVMSLLQDDLQDIELKGYLDASSGLMRKRIPINEKRSLK